MVVASQDTATLKALDIAHHLHPVTNLHKNHEHGPLVITRGDGVRVWDSDGRAYIDGFAGLWCVNVGHGRSELGDAAKRQIEEIAYTPTFNGLSHPSVIKLAAKLASIYPGDINHFQFTSGGAESNELAFKISRYFWAIQGQTDKVKILSRKNGYHGVALAAMSATGIPAYWANFGPRVEGFIHLTAPYTYRNADGMSEDEFISSLVKELEEVIAREGAHTIAAMIGEPVQGTGGVIPPPQGYWKAIREVLTAHDILLIADEVITGFGRTGTMFGVEQYGYQPDMVSFAKGVTSGYLPLGGVGVSDRIYEQMIQVDSVFMHGFTYSGHPVPTALALDNIKIIEDEKLPENAGEVGAYLLDRLSELLGHQNVGDVRGKGLMAIVEVVKDKDTKEGFAPSDGVGPKLMAATRKNGIIVRAGDNGIAMSPPLTLTKQEADELVNAVQASLIEVLG
jgi:4-aminobutyrate--pyruvate transaminase